MSIYINGVDISHTITTTITTGTTLTRSHRTVLCNATAAAFTVTLPASANSKYQIYEIKKIDSTGNAVTVDANASETIDGDLTKSLNLQNESITIQSNGTSWYII